MAAYKLIKKLINAEKLEGLRGLLRELDSVEIANSLMQLKLKHQLVVLNTINKEIASDVLNHLRQHSPVLSGIVSEMNTEQLGEIIEEMDGDDAVDMVAILDDTKAEEVLETLPSKDREEITTLMKYDEESAGGIMDPNVVSVEKDQTVFGAIQRIREYIVQEEIETFYAVYVVDEFRHLIGIVSPNQLLLAEPHLRISQLMSPNVVAVDVDIDQEAVARIAQEYDLVVIPVIDKYLKLIGRITVDDLMDVLQEEYQEDLAHIAGTGSEEVLDTSIVRSSKDRLPWLILGLFGGFIAAFAMSHYEGVLTRLPQVMFFIPLVAALGGNIAIQSSSIVVRGLGTGEIHPSDLLRRLWKEIRVSLLNGPVCALIFFAMVYFITTNVKMGIIAGFALLAVVSMAATVGSVIPILLKRIDIDPAIATGPFITTANDVLGILIYLGITLSMLEYLV